MSAIATRTRPAITLRTAEASEAPALYAFIAAHSEEGHLLPRTLEDLTGHATRFVVVTRGRRIVACADLAALSPRVAEVRSLAVDRRERRSGLGAMIVDELRQRARHEGFEKLCAFTHAPAYFIQMGFSIVPHLWILEKLTTDCVKCPQFHQCGQYAMVLPLQTAGGRSLDLARGVPLAPVSVEEREGHASDGVAVAGCA